MSKALVSLMVNLLRICSLQATGHQAVYGLSLCVSTLVNLIVTGECSTGSHPGHLDFSQIDLNGRGIIGQDAQQTISVLAPITQDVLQLFSSNGFYKIACAVVGQKNLDRHTAEYSILERLSSQLREDDHAQFVCGPWVNDACKRFFTNFSNMWSPNSCFGDLRVVMELLLHTPQGQEKEQGQEKTPASKHHTMIKLFEALVAKAPKKHTIDFFCNKLFAAFAPPTAVSVSSAAEPTSDAAEPTSDAAEPTSDAAEPTPDATEPIPNAADDDSDQEEDEDEDEDDELLLLESPDLPAKDIRALVSVACNLRQSSEHPDMITADHVKDKLYHDKQETIPRAAMELTARLITAVRCITPRKDQPFSFATWFSTGLIRTT